ncbi:GNAT family N-acetyltransferase (plasmid) [Massilia litorea]|uniref:GNAT family N-acetyltransferase n=2 Tax=Massilia litorea TaxID=2769491 RepID=A0A7L9UDS0_9BURK|nr:GNAT family N-acetyltransferase [Massilia litorea]
MVPILTTALPTDLAHSVLTGQVPEPSRAVSPKEEYRLFCRQEPSIPLFSRDWWLDAAVGSQGWDVVVVKKGDVIIASMPYVLRTRYTMRVLSQPALTPILGPWLHELEGKLATRLSGENELMQALIDQLPSFDHFAQAWHHSRRNWQPFYWNGFQQTTYYTYVLPDLSNLKKLWAELDGNIRRIIAKAESKHRLQVRDDMSLDVLLELNRKTFERQGLVPPYTDEFVRRLDAACAERNCRKLLVAVDPHGIPLCGYYYVWDENSAYGLISGADPEYRHTGAASLCLWETVRHAASVTRQYNFCGSMIRSVEAYLRGFGGEHVPYFRVSKTPSPLLSLRQCILSHMGNR